MEMEEEPPRFVINDEDGMDETDVNLRGYIASIPPENSRLMIRISVIPN